MRKGQWVVDTKGHIGQITKKQKHRVWCRWLTFVSDEGWETQYPTWVEVDQAVVIPKEVADIARTVVINN